MVMYKQIYPSPDGDTKGRAPLGLRFHLFFFRARGAFFAAMDIAAEAKCSGRGTWYKQIHPSSDGDIKGRAPLGLRFIRREGGIMLHLYISFDPIRQYEPDQFIGDQRVLFDDISKTYTLDGWADNKNMIDKLLDNQ